MSARFRPRRRLRSELPALVMILALPVALSLAFPKGALGFAPSAPRSESGTLNAIIVLDAAREAKLLASARVAWQSDSSSRRGTRANLLACDFSRTDFRIAGGLGPDRPSRVAEETDYEIDLVPAGVAAEAPGLLEAEPSVETAPVFPKSEFLKLKENRQ